MPVVRVTRRFESQQAASEYAQAVWGNYNIIAIEQMSDAEYAANSPLVTPKMPDPMMVSGMLRAAADYAVMLAEALDKINAQQSVNRDVTP